MTPEEKAREIVAKWYDEEVGHGQPYAALTKRIAQAIREACPSEAGLEDVLDLYHAWERTHNRENYGRYDAFNAGFREAMRMNAIKGVKKMNSNKETKNNRSRDWLLFIISITLIGALGVVSACLMEKAKMDHEYQMEQLKLGCQASK